MRTPLSPLYVVCDADACARAGTTVVDFATVCLEGGARLFQLRAKHASGRWLFETASELATLARSAGAIFIVNDRADVARLAGAGGVHVGQDDLAPAMVRPLVGSDAIIGRSTHTIDQIESALEEPVDYLAIGPVFPTSTKEAADRPVGLGGVRAAAARAAARGLPVVAIGGVTLERAPAIVDAGASAVAVISDLLAGGDPAVRVREYLEALSRRRRD